MKSITITNQYLLFVITLHKLETDVYYSKEKFSSGVWPFINDMLASAPRGTLVGGVVYNNVIHCVIKSSTFSSSISMNAQVQLIERECFDKKEDSIFDIKIIRR